MAFVKNDRWWCCGGRSGVVFLWVAVGEQLSDGIIDQPLPQSPYH